MLRARLRWIGFDMSASLAIGPGFGFAGFPPNVPSVKAA